MDVDKEHKIDEKKVAAMCACIDHARALLASAQAVQAAGHPNIAYHLTTLALEEIGRRELIGVQSISSKSPVPPAWPEKHTQDHIKKLFWCFFGGSYFFESLTGKGVEEIDNLAKNIHFKRLAGLYVDHSDDNLGIPQDAITSDESATLIKFATARLEIAESEKLRDNVPAEEKKLQAWFLNATEYPDKRRKIFSSTSMSKLADLKDTTAWAKWLKSEFDKDEAEMQAAAEVELRRSRDLPTIGSKDKWKLRFRIISASHSIRQKAFTKWNKQNDWIKLSSAKKNELIVEIILRDNVPIEALWYFGWGLARHFVAALNIGTMGFWWWRMPEQISRYYERLEDLENGAGVGLDRNPSLKIDWGANRVLTEEDLDRVAVCFTALPGPNEREQHAAYNYYIGGLTFLSLNDIHWQCEDQAFGNFFESLKAMMLKTGDWKEGASFQESLLGFLGDLFPKLDERDHFAKICEHFETNNLKGVVVTLKEVAFIKIVCDTYFLRKLSGARIRSQPKAPIDGKPQDNDP